MTDYETTGAGTTRARAGVFALLVETSHSCRALPVTDAFGGTIRWFAHEIREAAARWHVVIYDALRVWPAGRRHARVHRFWRLFR